MPLRVPEEDKNLLGSMKTALVQGLQQRYEVFSGDQVAQKAKAIFLKESRTTTKKECDETRCMQDIAIAFQAELIATANVTKRDGGYFLALSINNIFDNKVVYSNSVTCKSCDSFQVVDKLKELSGTSTAVIEIMPELRTPVIGGTTNDLEASLWLEAQKGNTIDDYQVYLDSYPKGKYVPFANARIKKIKEAADAATEQQQQQAWEGAQKENSEAGFAGYLKTYPNGRFAGFAKIRLDKLKNDVAGREEETLWNKAELVNDNNTVQVYINKYPSGRHIAAANLKLKLLKEDEAKGPIKMVSVPGKNYEIGKYEVTQGEWRTVMGSNNSKFTKCGDNCPIENVSWNDVQTFIKKLNTMTGKQYRLPTEAEWEYACHAQGTHEYCGGDNVDSVGWYDKNSGSTIHPVGSKQANAFGIYDMSGNIWEWVVGEGSGAPILRGGSWDDNSASFLRATYRVTPRFSPQLSDAGGFRLVRTLR
jgi:formylglycine-generating enzyme required for sulfatase activity